MPMRDFAMIGRPIVLHAPSFDTFVSRTKGTSIDLVLEGPGPITRTTAELVDAVDALIDNGLAPAELYQARALRFGQLAGPVPSPDEVAASLIEGH